MCELKSIDEIIKLSDENYKAYISKLLEKEDAGYKIDVIDDELLKLVDTRAEDVERICRINSAVFAKIEEKELSTFLLAYNYNTSLIATIRQNKFEQAKSKFLEGISFCQENLQYEAGKSLSQNVFSLFKSNQIPLDEAPFLLTRITDFYKSLGKHQDIVEALCAAASYFADTSAFQPAYRALHDAQEIAISKQLSRSQIRILETQGMVALIEGDLDCAENEFQKCIEFYKAMEVPLPFHVKANSALVKLRKKDYAAARDIYQMLLLDYPEASISALNHQVKINLLVCYRELGDTSSVDDLTRQIEMVLDQCDLELTLPH